MDPEKNPYLKRKPCIFLIGKPEELGFKTKTINHKKETIDSFGISWYVAVQTVHSLIFAEHDVPYGLSTMWVKDTLYAYECAKMLVRYDKQNYRKFRHLCTDAEKTNDITKLNAYSPVIKDCEIPKSNTPTRSLFAKCAKMWIQDVTSRERKRNAIMTNLKAIQENLA